MAWPDASFPDAHRARNARGPSHNRRMTLDEFRGTLAQAEPPAGLAPPLEALWHDGQGDWDRAHRVAMDAGGADAAWVHAYLHRKEGDLENARYWYRKAKRPEAAGTAADEWAAIAARLLDSVRR
jgi:hypothetical protein